MGSVFKGPLPPDASSVRFPAATRRRPSWLELPRWLEVSVKVVSGVPSTQAAETSTSRATVS